MRYDSLKNKVVIVTGASSGIGLAIVREFTSHSAKIVLASPEEEKLKEIVTDLTEKGYRRCFTKEKDSTPYYPRMAFCASKQMYSPVSR